MYEIAAASFKKYYINLLRNSSEQAFVIPSIIGCAQKGNILNVIGICQRYIDGRDTSFYNSFTCLRRKAKREFLTWIHSCLHYCCFPLPDDVFNARNKQHRRSNCFVKSLEALFTSVLVFSTLDYVSLVML